MQSHPLRHRFGCLAFVYFATLAALSAQDFRVATFNASMNRRNEGELLRDLALPDRSSARQIRRVAEIIQTVRPDILLLNEFDYDAEGEGPKRFQENFLAVSQNGQEAITYRYRFSAPVNTGVHSGQDFDNNRRTISNPGSNDYAGDAFGFGTFPGQYGMAVFSHYPIAEDLLRSFQSFLWKDMPEALIPDGQDGRPTWYDENETAVFRLSSKSHWDLPVNVGGGKLLHLLVSHPTPPVFDGREDRNGRRNHDEIRLWKDYLSSGASDYIYDDKGLTGGLPEGKRFVILGDLNADPNDGDSVSGAIKQLLDHPRVNTTKTPSSPGGAEVADASHKGDPAEDTADFSRENLRADYALPSKDGLTLRDAKVFWPTRQDGQSAVVRGASDHRMVYLDLTINATAQEPSISNIRLTRDGTEATLQWRGQPGAVYQVQWSQDLKEPWKSIASPTILASQLGTAYTFVDQSETKRRFYRVLEAPSKSP